ncbi:MAG: sugar-specific transcriptional regulator TrmB [Promethearchaeota archaeon]|nr:MAG: sugar-specific transcriptional regulator TrmB [Candidatus Lokiarchaeota archaeon]
MSKTLKKRAICLNLIKSITKTKGYFTITDLIKETSVPRSTIQDWINRLLNEGYVNVIEESSGSRPARFNYLLKSEYPTTACKNIFTCVDRENGLVEIYHFCGSEGCTSYCAYAHQQTGGVIINTRHDGLFLRELARIGRKPLDGLGSKSAVGIEEITIEGDEVVQTIRATGGGPAYSLTETMGGAMGVRRIDHTKKGTHIEGKIYTPALQHLTIGIDDTDDLEEGATWAISLSLLNNLKPIHRIAHRIVFLNPQISYKTLGNNASFIELALQETDYAAILNDIQDFLRYKTVSEETAIAVMKGLVVPDALIHFANKVRVKEVAIADAEKVAKELGIDLIEITGERGKIGALASIAFLREKPDTLLNPEVNIELNSF